MPDQTARQEAAAAAKRRAKAKAERLKAQRLKAQRLKAQRLKAQRLKAQRAARERAKAQRAKPVVASTPAAPAGATLAVAADTGSSAALAALKVLLFGIPLLLLLAAMVPLSPSVVPHRVGIAWERARLDLAVVGGGILLVEGLVYLLAR